MKTYKRINKLAEAVNFVHSLLQKNLTVCDIGTDHGYLAEQLSQKDYINKVIATDISQKSLQKLEDLIKLKSLTKIDTLVGDGLSVIDSADVVVIAGIGGFEIMSMLLKQNQKSDGNFKCKYFILQPAQNVIELRRWIIKNKIKLLKDYVIFDAERFYPILIIDVSKKKRTKNSIFNIWLGKDNNIKDEDFYKYVIEIHNSLSFFTTLPKERIKKDYVLNEKYKLFKLIEKMLKLWYISIEEKIC